jgi:hypothetical protein
MGSAPFAALDVSAAVPLDGSEATMKAVRGAEGGVSVVDLDEPPEPASSST